MSDKIAFDYGVKEYEVNGRAILRFNPTDPNVYKRFKEVAEFLTGLKKEINEKSEQAGNGADIIDILSECDQIVKEKLRYVFGEGNDFNAIFDGGNVMALASNGEMVITNFLNGIRPIIESGIKEYAKAEARKAVVDYKK